METILVSLSTEHENPPMEGEEKGGGGVRRGKGGGKEGREREGDRAEERKGERQRGCQYHSRRREIPNG